VTAACLAHLGNDITVLEMDAARVARLRSGEVPIREPGLDGLVEEGLTSGRLRFDTDPSTIRGTRLAIVAVGTLDARGEWTDRTVRVAVEALARDAEAPRAIVIRSTLLPGSSVEIAEAARQIDPSVEVAFNPEFTREATAVNDFLMPDRVVIGVAKESVHTSRLVEDLRRLYAPLEAPVIVTDLASAETIKVASNVFLAAKITFANELARLCAASGADVAAVVDGVGLDKRIGRSFLSPGPGFGGSCFPSQARAMPHVALRHGVRTPLIDAVGASNAYQADWLIDRLELVAGQAVAGKRLTVLGLTFKADTDDIRESPAMLIARRLVERGATVKVFDPLATARATSALSASGIHVDGCSTAQEACAGADAIFVTTEWPEFRQLEWSSIAPTMRGTWIADARHIVDVEDARRAGLAVVVLGVVPSPSVSQTVATGS
jgi:UDPglucose 6-dehydrogenase